MKSSKQINQTSYLSTETKNTKKVVGTKLTQEEADLVSEYSSELGYRNRSLFVRDVLLNCVHSKTINPILTPPISLITYMDQCNTINDLTLKNESLEIQLKEGSLHA